ncbi:hypothetical protein Tco_0239393, partial [Tanacetum coccineum]
MYRIASTITQTRTPQLPHASRNTNWIRIFKKRNKKKAKSNKSKHENGKDKVKG